ncbi:MAG: RecX family transcriptional regulator [Clostridia bacterium]|nr:RecX family transcriptional regulator [Clostridia bacterium]
MDEIRICGVRAADGGAHLLIDVEYLQDGEKKREHLALMTARLAHLPEVGAISAEGLAELRREAEVCAAIGAGLRCLGAGGSSKRRLVEKLRLRGFDFATANAATEELAEKGYLREEESALREAEKDLAKLWGDRRILSDLQAKGYNGGALQYAKARLRSEDSVARCAQLIRKRRMALPADEAEARKFFAALVRYGYSPEEIKKVLKK